MKKFNIYDWKITLNVFKCFSESDKSTIIPEALGKLQEIQKMRWRPIAKELEGEDPYQFLRAYSPGKLSSINPLTAHVRPLTHQLKCDIFNRIIIALNLYTQLNVHVYYYNNYILNSSI